MPTRDGVAELEFTPTPEAATVTNTFRMLLDNDVVLDGIVHVDGGRAAARTAC